ncbi:MAG: hypothetical protein QXV97_07505 [Candidatus Caldarchaeum sp.]
MVVEEAGYRIVLASLKKGDGGLHHLEGPPPLEQAVRRLPTAFRNS